MEVAIALDLREPEVTQLYKESWNLKQIHDLNLIYLETKGDLTPYLKLYRLAKANNDLLELERRYYNLKSEVDSLEEKKQNLVRIIQNYNGQVAAVGKTFDSYCLRCEQQEKKLADLRRQRMREEALVRQFENNNAEYIKIRKTAEEKVRDTLSKWKDLLKLALSSLTESIRQNPEKYSSIIYNNNMPPVIRYNMPDYSFYPYGQQQCQPNYYDVQTMLIEDAAKLFENLAKELVDEILSDYTVGISRPFLPLLPALDKDPPPN